MGAYNIILQFISSELPYKNQDTYTYRNSPFCTIVLTKDIRQEIDETGPWYPKDGTNQKRYWEIFYCVESYEQPKWNI